MNHSDYDRLHGPKLLHSWGGDILSASEAITRMAINPLWRFDDPMRDRRIYGAKHIQTVSSIIRTGSLFVFARDDIPPPEDKHQSPEYLPPLPFPRMWLEIANMDDEEARFVDFDGHYCQFLGFAIREVTAYEEWDIFVPMWDFPTAKAAVQSAIRDDPSVADTLVDPYRLTVCREFQLKRDPKVGKVGIAMAQTELDQFQNLQDDGTITTQWAAIANGLATFPETLINLLHTLGVVHEPLLIPRPRRREFRRRHGVEHPNFYWVHVRSTTDPEPGKGDRQFRHRWLVRGHYRKHVAGTHTVPGKGVCTWVRPYVKGPEGAPWKGRPIYTTVAKEAA